jgi:hypothetical protein
MAKKKAAAQDKPVTAMQVPTEQQFNALVRAVKNANADMADAQSEKGAAVKKAIKNHHLDRDAFSIYQKLARLSDKKLSITMAHLEHYAHIGGLEERATRQGDMIGHDKELAETNVTNINANGSRKKRSEKKAAESPFENQRDREKAADFDGDASGEAVH